MKKYLLIGIIGVILAVIIFCVVAVGSECSFVQKQTKKKIDFQLIDSYAVDTRGMCERLRIVEDSPFTCFLQMTAFKNLSEYFIDEFNFEIPEFDFDYQDKYMVITFGRELEEIEYTFFDEMHRTNASIKADITFAEEYHNQTMYIYAMDKILLCDSFLDGNSFYIMNGDEKIFYGNNIIDLNERMPFGETGL